MQLIIEMSKSFADQNPRKIRNEELLDDEHNALSLDSKVLHYNALYVRHAKRERNRKGRANIVRIGRLF